MSSNAFFSDLLTSISERGRTLLRRVGSSEPKQDGAELISLCEALVSGRGEASGTAMAREVLDRYRHLNDAQRLAFFEALTRDFGPDREKLARVIESWRAQRSDEDASDLHFASEPRRQELVRRLNRAPGGTSELVAMRADLLRLMNGHSELAALDRDVSHLLSSWFNRGFLVLRRIDWSTPANILEQIIRYEAVHEIHDWDDLRRRIDPIDRRCYAFFHPAMPDAPLIFVEVALTETIPGAIAPLLAVDRQPVPTDRARTAARGRPPAGADRSRPHRRVLLDLQHPARTRRHLVRQLPDQAGGRGAPPRAAEARHLRDTVAGAGLHDLAEVDDGRDRRGSQRAEPLERAALVRGCDRHRRAAHGDRAARRALLPEGAHAQGQADRPRRPLPSRQRRAAGAHQLARRSLHQGP